MAPNISTDKCIICGHNLLDSIYVLPNFPISMNVYDVQQDIETETLDYCVCKRCYTVQLRNKPPLHKVYNGNHNTEIVGETWKQHFDLLKEFAVDHGLSGRVLEVGDPSAKLAKRCVDHIDTWEIVEPNPNYDAIKNEPKICFHKSFLEDWKDETKYDFVIHSHVLEHSTDPIKFMKACADHLKDDGKLIFSIPNMEGIMKVCPLPVSIINYEHLFLLSQELLKFICFKSGLKLRKICYFKDHSLFFVATKKERFNWGKDIYPIKDNRRLLTKFQQNIDSTINYLNELNSILESDRIPSRGYIFGSHVKSQFILHNLTLTSSSKLKGILDNSTSKHYKWLYGSDLETYPTEHLSIISYPIFVITSHLGIYREEIEKQIKHQFTWCI